jgi:Ran GTPase-activating protein (RanGAP) involved in mRNA processing and transport
VLNLNSTLTELVVGSNTIGAPGCIKIAEALEGNGATNLRMLNFSHCQILDAGAQALLQAMQENDALRNQLEMLDVSHNLLSRETMSSLVDLLGDKVTVNEILQASEKRNANSMFRQAQSVTDHRAQEHEALSTAIARAAELAAAEAAATALAAKEAAAAQAASVTNSAFVPGSWRLHYPMPEHKPAGWAAHYPVSTGVATTL